MGKWYISFLVHPGWSPGITVCLSISGIYNMIYCFLSDVHRRLIGKFYISFLVHPGWSPGIIVCLSISGIYNMIYCFLSDVHRLLIGKCYISFLFWFIQVEVLAWLYAWVFLGHITWTNMYSEIPRFELGFRWKIWDYFRLSGISRLLGIVGFGLKIALITDTS